MGRGLLLMDTGSDEQMRAVIETVYRAESRRLQPGLRPVPDQANSGGRDNVLSMRFG